MLPGLHATSCDHLFLFASSPQCLLQLHGAAHDSSRSLAPHHQHCPSACNVRTRSHKTTKATTLATDAATAPINECSRCCVVGRRIGPRNLHRAARRTSNVECRTTNSECQPKPNSRIRSSFCCHQTNERTNGAWDDAVSSERWLTAIDRRQAVGQPSHDD